MNKQVYLLVVPSCSFTFNTAGFQLLGEEKVSGRPQEPLPVPEGLSPAAPHSSDIGDPRAEAAQRKNPPSPCCPGSGGVWGCWPNICSPRAACSALLEVQLSPFSSSEFSDTLFPLTILNTHSVKYRACL